MKAYDALLNQTQIDQMKLMDKNLIIRCFNREISRHDYILFLKQAYNHVKHTVPLLMLCGGKLDERYNWLRQSIAHYIEEEIGHEEWILNDLEACGVPKAEVANEEPFLSTNVFVSYIYDIIQRKNPLGLLGMIYVLESSSVLLASKAADNIKSTLNLPDKAFSYLYSHGELDKSHMTFFEDLINQIDDQDDIDFIITSAKHLFTLYGNILYEIDHVHHEHVIQDQKGAL